MPVETFERTMQVNLHGAYFMTQAAANQMVAQGSGGSIIAMSSISALVGGEYQTHYTPTKAGVLSLMQSAAIALGKYRIRCNALLPGTILTEINKDDLADTKKRTYMEGRIPLGRLGQPEDMVGPTLFLASELASYVTGAALLVDGGLSLIYNETAFFRAGDEVMKSSPRRTRRSIAWRCGAPLWRAE